MDNKRLSFLISKKGQTVVEYILIMGVVTTVAVSVINSDAFKRLLGKDSEVFSQYGSYIQYSYRHAHPGSGDMSVDDDYANQGHRSYVDPATNESRFFTPLEPYSPGG